MNKVAVVTVNYHGARDTFACITSLKKSNIPVTLVVVDNSPNDTELETGLQDYPDVKLINAPDNIGFGRGNNLGIEWILKNTNCEFVFILNNDATVRSDTIGCLIQAMGDHPEAAIVSPRIVFAEEPDKLWYGGGEVDWKRGGAKTLGVLGAADAPLARQARHVSFATGCAMFFRRSVLEEQKGFDSRFFMYEEDLELSLRVQESGWKIWYEPSALVFHVGQGSQENREKFVPRFSPKNPNLTFLVYQGVKNSLLNMGMHAHAKNKIKFFLYYPVFLGLKCVQWALNGRWDAVKSTMKAVIDYRSER